jgi:glycosyltransferase involved in cell wall biosynthesis
MNILFIHEAPGQFKELHSYINASGLANSWILCSSSAYNRDKKKYQNLIPFPLPNEDPKSYFYTMRLEARIKRSFYFRKKILELKNEMGLDLVVCHGSGGYPLHLFGEVGLPIISYIEFPSFSHHGHDKKYPQPEFARYADKLFEMSSYHQVIRSDLVIVPSVYARNMFPEYMRHKIFSQMEGFRIEKSGSSFKRESGFFYIGFTARDLSSAKGFEQFILISKSILKKRNDVRFVFCGSPKVLYSYETDALKVIYGEGTKKTFMEYILEREEISFEEDSIFKHLDFLNYDEYSSFIEGMDLFLYPLQYGSANWGIFELLFRGSVVVASNRCFLPEIIKSGKNGLLCDYDDIDAWVNTVNLLLADPDLRNRISSEAVSDANVRYSIERVAGEYMTLFGHAVSNYKLSANA